MPEILISKFLQKLIDMGKNKLLGIQLIKLATPFIYSLFQLLSESARRKSYVKTKKFKNRFCQKKSTRRKSRIFPRPITEERELHLNFTILH